MTQERVEVKVVGVYMHQEGEQPTHYFFLLEDARGRRMPCWVGQFEAWAISFALDGKPLERPMTHDATMLLLEAAGASLTEACINDLRDETFYATVTLQGVQGTREIDARPSDAVALALRAKCPLYVAEHVMAAAGRTDGADLDAAAG